MLTRRAFIASLTGALVAPRLALPQPAPTMVPMVADELVAYHVTFITEPFPIRLNMILVGDAAREAFRREPHLWSAVMCNRRLS
jgi:hypothetical protein